MWPEQQGIMGLLEYHGQALSKSGQSDCGCMEFQAAHGGDVLVTAPVSFLSWMPAM